MRKITIGDIKILRKEMGVGVMDCKRALEESKGDVEKAKKWLKKQGILKAEKKSERLAREGIIGSYVHHNSRVAALVLLRCETDFAARCEDFAHLARELAMQVASMKPKNVKLLLKQEYIRDSSMTVEDLIKQTAGKVGEKIVVAEFVRMEA